MGVSQPGKLFLTGCICRFFHAVLQGGLSAVECGLLSHREVLH